MTQKTADEEIRRLQGSINDLTSIQALPAIWNGRESGHITSTLLDVLASMLRLDFAYARLSDSINGSPVEFVRSTQRRTAPPQPQEIGRALERWLTNQSANAPLAVPNPAGDGEVRIAPLRLGLMDEIGLLVAGSKRADFPTPTETLLLRVAANLALVALQEARQFHEQNRTAEELERRVADRTAQLTTVNEALRESEKKYRTLFDSIDEGFCTIEVLFDGNDNPIDYRFLEVNPSFEKQTGIQNAQGRRMREIAPQHEEHWFEIYGRIVLTGEPMRFENEAKQLGRWYDVYAFRVEDPKHRRVGILFNDITERKRAEVVGQRLAAIVDSSEDAIVSKDLNGTIESWNGGAERLFGYQASEVIGKSILMIVPPDRHDEERGILERIRRGERIKPYETVRMREDGSLLDISLTVSPLRDAAGRIIGASKIARDITERKRAEAALRDMQMQLAHANRVATMGQLSASITHEVNQPITAAVTCAEAANNSVSVRTQLAEGLPRVQGDRVQLQQVLLNLIINAIEAMRDVGEEERELLIRTRNEPGGLSVEVRDTGPGFAPETLERVFEAFYTTKPGGLGLGLSICRSIIEAHNGRLWASPNVPRGAIFGFIAPAHPAAAS